MEPEVSRIIGSNARELPKGTRRTPNPKAAKKKGGLEEDWGVASPGLPGELPRATRPPPRSEADDGEPRIRTGAHGVAMVRELHLVRSTCPQPLARSACSTHDPRCVVVVVVVVAARMVAYRTACADLRAPVSAHDQPTHSHRGRKTTTCPRSLS